MIKTILVGLDGSDHARTAGAYARWLAAKLQARLVALHVVDLATIEGTFFHDISGSLGFEPYLDLSSKIRVALKERGDIILEAFSKEDGSAGVPIELINSIGVVANEIAERARVADLVVIGHRGVNERYSTGLLGGNAESITRKSPKPVFVTPMEFHPCSKPLLAYDGSAKAAAVMHQAAELCGQLGTGLTVLTVHSDEARGNEILEEASKYLEPYGLEVSLELQRTGNAPERIANFIRERSHDLLFIGAYGHSRIIEMVLGSTTEYVLRNADCPVYLHR
jgi:nucleotide-binding universal stress UspA family protein